MPDARLLFAKLPRGSLGSLLTVTLNAPARAATVTARYAPSRKAFTSELTYVPMITTPEARPPLLPEGGFVPREATPPYPERSALPVDSGSRYQSPQGGAGFVARAWHPFPVLGTVAAQLGPLSVAPPPADDGVLRFDFSAPDLSAWTQPSGGWALATPPGGDSQAATLTTLNGASPLVRTSETASGARTMSVRVRVDASSNDPHPGLVLAYQDANNYDALYLRANGAQLVIWQVRGGGASAVVLADLPAQPRGVFLTLSATINASNTVTQVQLNSAAFTANYALVGGQRFGVWQHRGAGEPGYVDDLTVVPAGASAAGPTHLRVTGAPAGSTLWVNSARFSRVGADGSAFVDVGTGTEAFLIYPQGRGAVRVTGAGYGEFRWPHAAPLGLDALPLADEGQGGLTRRAGLGASGATRFVGFPGGWTLRVGAARTPFPPGGVLDVPGSVTGDILRTGDVPGLLGGTWAAGTTVMHWATPRLSRGADTAGPLVVTVGDSPLTWGGQPWVSGEPYPAGADGYALIVRNADGSLRAYEPDARPGQSYLIVAGRSVSGSDSINSAEAFRRCTLTTGVWSGTWGGAYGQEEVCITSPVDGVGRRNLYGAESGTSADERGLLRARRYERSDVGNLTGEAGTRWRSRNTVLDAAQGSEARRVSRVNPRGTDSAQGSERSRLVSTNARGADAGAAFEWPVLPWTPARFTPDELGPGARFSPNTSGSAPTLSVDAQGRLRLTSATSGYPYVGLNGFTLLRLPAAPFRVTVTLDGAGGYSTDGAGLDLLSAAGGSLVGVATYRSAWEAVSLLGSGLRNGYGSGTWPAPFTVEQTATHLIVTTRNGTWSAAHAPERVTLAANLTDHGGQAIFTDLRVTGQGAGLLSVARVHQGADGAVASEGSGVTTRGGRDTVALLSEGAQLLRARARVRVDAAAASETGLRVTLNPRGADGGLSFDARAVFRRRALTRADAGTASEARQLTFRGVRDDATGADSGSAFRRTQRLGGDTAQGSDAARRASANPRRADSAAASDAGRAQPNRFTRAEAAAASDAAHVQPNRFTRVEAAAGADSGAPMRRRVRAGSDAALGQERALARGRGAEEFIRVAEEARRTRARTLPGSDALRGAEGSARTTNRPVGTDGAFGLDGRAVARRNARHGQDSAAGRDEAAAAGRGGVDALHGSDSAVRRRFVRLTRQDATQGAEAGRVLPSRVLRADQGRATEGHVLARVMPVRGADSVRGTDAGRRKRRGAEEILSGADTSAIFRRVHRPGADAAQGTERRDVTRSNNRVLDSAQGQDRSGMRRERFHPGAEFGALTDQILFKGRGAEYTLHGTDQGRKVMRNATLLFDSGAGAERATLARLLRVTRLDSAQGQEGARRKRRGAEETLSGAERADIIRRNRPARFEDARAQDAGRVGRAQVQTLDNFRVIGETGALLRARRWFRTDAGRGAERADTRARGGEEFVRGQESAQLASRTKRALRTDSGQGQDRAELRQPRRALTRLDTGRAQDSARRTTNNNRVADAAQATERAAFPRRTLSARDRAASQDGGRLRNGQDTLRVGEVLATPREWTWRPELTVVPGPRELRDPSEGVALYPWVTFVSYEGTPYMARGNPDSHSWLDAEAGLIDQVPDFPFHLSVAFDQNAERVAAWQAPAQPEVTVSWMELRPAREWQTRTFPGVDPVVFSTGRVMPVESGTDVIAFYLDPNRTRVLYRLQVEQYRFEREYATLPTPGLHLDQVSDDGSSILLSFGDAERTRAAVRAGPFPRFSRHKATLAAFPGGGTHQRVTERLTVNAAPESAYTAAHPAWSVSWRVANRAGSLAWLDVAFTDARPAGGAHTFARSFVNVPVITTNPRPDAADAWNQSFTTLTHGQPSGGRAWWNTYTMPRYTHAARLDTARPAGGSHKEA